MPAEARLLAVGLFLSVASNNLMTPLLPAIQHDLKLSLASMGTFVSTYGLARLIVDLPSGAMSVRWGPRPIVLTGIILNAVSSLGGFFAPNFRVLLLARIGAGVGAGLVATVVLSALSEVAPAEIRGRVMSLYQVANNLGIAVYPLVGGVVGALFGWRAAFLVAAAAAAIAGLTLAPVLQRLRTAHLAVPPRPAPPRLGRRRLQLPALAFVAIYFGVVANMMNRHGFRNTVLPLFAASSLHLTAVQTASGVTCMSLVGILVAVPGATLGDRIGRKRIVVTGLMLVGLADLLFPVLARGYPTFMLACILVGAGDFFSSSQTALISDMASGSARAMALSAYRFFVDAGAFLGPSVFAWVFAIAGGRAAIVAAAVVLLAGAAVSQGGIPRLMQPGRQASKPA